MVYARRGKQMSKFYDRSCDSRMFENIRDTLVLFLHRRCSARASDHIPRLMFARERAAVAAILIPKNSARVESSKEKGGRNN